MAPLAPLATPMLQTLKPGYGPASALLEQNSRCPVQLSSIAITDCCACSCSVVMSKKKKKLPLVGQWQHRAKRHKRANSRGKSLSKYPT